MSGVELLLELNYVRLSLDILHTISFIIGGRERRMGLLTSLLLVDGSKISKIINITNYCWKIFVRERV